MSSKFEQRLLLLLSAVAVSYAFIAGLRTVTEFDLGWQMATARWIVEHHQIPSTEVFSYTAAGQPWIYPVGAGFIFYGLYLLGGYSLISWFTAIACAVTVLLLLRRGNVISASLAILAVPLIASRASARAEVFTVILFAAALSLLWEQHETGQAKLWLLPAMMILWVNLHPGFVTGLGLIAAYVLLEIWETIDTARRDAAVERLRRAFPWIAATFAVTLINPWGWGIYQVLLTQQAAMNVHSQLILEWAPIPMNWAHIVSAFSPADPDQFYVMLLFLAVAVIVVVLRRRIAEVLLLAAAAFFPIRHVRFTALFSIVTVILASSILYSMFSFLNRRYLLPVLTAAGLFALPLAAMQMLNLVTGRTYRAGSEIASFGTGLSWWFPAKAAAFVKAQKLPGQVFAAASEGGFLEFELGDPYKSYIDGRAIPFGTDLMVRSGALKATPPDSPLWDQEVTRYGITTIVVPLGRYEAVQFFPVLKQFCATDRWAPVYLDEVSAVFVRHAPETESLIARLRIDCSTAPLPAISPAGRGGEAFNHWANAASVLRALDRPDEALQAIGRALEISENGYLHFLRGHILQEAGNFAGAEQDYLAAAKIEPKLVAPWSALAAYYQSRRRTSDAIRCWQKAAAVSRAPWDPLENLAYAELMAQHPKNALAAFDQASRSLPEHSELLVDHAFLANIAHGRARCWFYLGNLPRAIGYEEEAAQWLPDNPDLWRQLGDLYASAHRDEDARRARAHMGR